MNYLAFSWVQFTIVIFLYLTSIMSLFLFLSYLFFTYWFTVCQLEVLPIMALAPFFISLFLVFVAIRLFTSKTRCISASRRRLITLILIGSSTGMFIALVTMTATGDLCPGYLGFVLVASITLSLSFALLIPCMGWITFRDIEKDYKVALSSLSDPEMSKKYNYLPLPGGDLESLISV